LRVSEECWTNPVHWFSITLRGSVQPFYPAAALVHRAFHLVSLFQLRLKMLHLLCRYVHATQCMQLKPPQQTVGPSRGCHCKALIKKKCSLILFWCQNKCIKRHDHAGCIWLISGTSLHSQVKEFGNWRDSS
jgi:hypothetical protein